MEFNPLASGATLLDSARPSPNSTSTAGAPHGDPQDFDPLKAGAKAEFNPLDAGASLAHGEAPSNEDLYKQFEQEESRSPWDRAKELPGRALSAAGRVISPVFKEVPEELGTASSLPDFGRRLLSTATDAKARALQEFADFAAGVPAHQIEQTIEHPGATARNLLSGPAGPMLNYLGVGMGGNTKDERWQKFQQEYFRKQAEAEQQPGAVAKAVSKIEPVTNIAESIAGPAEPLPETSRLASTILQLAVPDAAFGAVGKVGKAVDTALTASRADRAAELAGRAAQTVGKGAEYVGSIPERAAGAVTRSLLGEEAGAAVTKKVAGAEEIAGIPAVIAEHVADITTGGLALGGKAKLLQKAGEMTRGLGEAAEAMATAPKNSIWGRAAAVARDPNSPGWMKTLLAGPIGKKAVEVGSHVADLAKGAGTGAAIGGLYGTGTGQSPEELAESIGGGAAIGGGVHAAKTFGLQNRKILARSAGAVADLYKKHLQEGITPETMSKVPDSAMTMAAAIEQHPGINAKVRFMSPEQLSALKDSQGNQLIAGHKIDGVWDRESRTMYINASAKDIPGTVLHEMGHPIFDAAVLRHPEIGRIIDTDLAKQGKNIEDIKRTYMEALVGRELDGLDPQTREAALLKRTETWDAAFPNNSWIYSEVLAENYKNSLDSKKLLALDPTVSGVIKGAIKTMFGAEENAKGFFHQYANVVQSPALTKLSRGLLRSMREYRSGLDTLGGEGKGVKVTPEMFGKRTEAPLHKLPNGELGNDFVVAQPDGSIKRRAPSAVIRIIKDRVAAVRSLFDPKVVKPLGDPSPEMSYRRNRSGGVEISGTKLPPTFDGLSVYSDDTKNIAHIYENAIKTGDALSSWYHRVGTGKGEKTWAQSVASLRGAIAAESHDVQPINFKVDKQGNVLIQVFDRQALEARMADWANRKGLVSLEQWGGDQGKVMADLKTYLQNHAEGLKGETTIGPDKANTLNILLSGNGVSEFADKNPLREHLKGKDRQGIVRSLRLDRIETVEKSRKPELPRPQYEKLVSNFHPMAEADELVRRSPEEWAKIVDYRGPYGGGQTGWSFNLGSQVHTIEDLAHLRYLHEQARDQYRAAMKAGDMNTAASWASKSQAMREAYEAATDETLDGKPSGTAAFIQKHFGKDFKTPMPEERRSPEATATELMQQAGMEHQAQQLFSPEKEPQEKADTYVRTANPVRSTFFSTNDLFGPMTRKQAEYVKEVERRHAAANGRYHFTTELTAAPEEGERTLSLQDWLDNRPKISREADTKAVQSFSPAEKDHAVGGILAAIHFSDAGTKLTTIDPAKMRVAHVGKYWEPTPKRSFFFIKGSEIGDRDQKWGNHTPYEAKIDGSKIYDATGDDPLGFFQSWPVATEQPIIDAGYKGVLMSANGGKDKVLISYEKVPVKPAKPGTFSPDDRWWDHLTDSKLVKDPEGNYTTQIPSAEKIAAAQAAGYKTFSLRGNGSHHDSEYNPTLSKGNDEKYPLTVEGVAKGYKDAQDEASADWKMAYGEMDDTGTYSPNEEVRSNAEDYMRGAKLPYEPHTRNVQVDVPLAKRVADWFETAKHEPDSPAVKEAYDALAAETAAQYRHLEGKGIKMEPWRQEGQPYANSAAMMEDVRANKHLWYFPTEAGYGEGQQTIQHPMLAKGENGLPVNDMFRAVHDYYGHAKEGYEFGPRGELNAYLAHSSMFSDKAKPAMAAETLGQNSWVNYGKHMRNEAGDIPKKGEPGYVPQAERKFAEQKATIAPREFTEHQFSPKDDFNAPAPEADAQPKDENMEKNVKVNPRYDSAWVLQSGRAYKVDGGAKDYHDSFAQEFSDFAGNSEEFQAKAGAMRIANRNSARQIDDYGNAELGISISRKPTPGQLNYLRRVLSEVDSNGDPVHTKVAVDVTGLDGKVVAAQVFDHVGKPSQAKILNFLREPKFPVDASEVAADSWWVPTVNGEAISYPVKDRAMAEEIIDQERRNFRVKKSDVASVEPIPNPYPLFSPEVDEKKVERLATRIPSILNTKRAAGATSPGITFNVSKGQERKNGFAVSIYPDLSQQLTAAPTREAVSEFIRNNWELLSNPEHSLGIWDDTKGSSGKVWMDVVATFNSKALAEFAGKKYNQVAIGDISKYQAGLDGDVPTGGTGETIPNLPPASERLNTIKTEHATSTHEPVIQGPVTAANPLPTVRDRPRQPEELHKLSLDAAITEPDMRGFLETVADKFRKIPGFKNVPKDPVAAVKEISSRLQQNIKFWYEKTTPGERSTWRRWYDLAKKMSQDWGSEFGVNWRTVAAINSRFSPQMPWFQNVTLTRTLLETMRENPTVTEPLKALMNEALARRSDPKERAEFLSKIKGVEVGQKLSDLDNFQTGVFVRVFNEDKHPGGLQTHDHELEPQGQEGVTGWNADWPSLESIVSIYRDPSRKNVNSELGINHKVRSFYNNHVMPESPDWTTVDTHAVAAALMRPVGSLDYETKDNFGGATHKASGYRGNYFLYQDAYEKVAKELGILPRELQSIVWEKARGAVSPEAKRAIQDSEFKAINQIHKQIDSGKMTPAQGREAILKYYKEMNESMPGSTPAEADATEPF